MGEESVDKLCDSGDLDHQWLRNNKRRKQKAEFFDDWSQKLKHVDGIIIGDKVTLPCGSRKDSFSVIQPVE